MNATENFDLADPALYVSERPEAIWAHLRATGAPYWNAEANGPGFWAITRYAQALLVYRDTESFSSEGGMMLGIDRRDSSSAAAAAGRMLIVTDPPRHAKMRAIVNRSFTPRALERLVPNVGRVAHGLLEAVVDQPECEFVSEVAARLPVAVICDLLGVPSGDRDLMVDLTSTAFGVAGDAASDQDQARAHADIFMYFAELVAHRRRHPGDDVISALVGGRIDGSPVTDDEAVLNCHGFITGGNETTRHASTTALLQLIRCPDEWRNLRSGSVSTSSAVEEVLRWSSPGMHVLRTARTDVEIADTLIRAGDQVTVWNGSANRDEDVFPEADAFHVDRDPNKHLAFGIGEHFCLGTSLARIELRALLDALLATVSHGVELAPPRRLRSNFLRGYVAAPVRLASS